MANQIKQIIGIIMLIIMCIACTNTHEYPAEAVSTFKASCVSSSGNKQMCACVLEKIQEKYSYEDFSKIEKAIGVGGDTVDFMAFVEEVKRTCATVPAP